MNADMNIKNSYYVLPNGSCTLARSNIRASDFPFSLETETEFGV